jgi:hypothetical protein
MVENDFLSGKFSSEQLALHSKKKTPEELLSGALFLHEAALQWSAIFHRSPAVLLSKFSEHMTC